MKVCIIGLGLIGGSFALALRRKALAERIYGVDASERNAQKAIELGLVDEVVDFDKAIEVADIVAIATPVDAIPQIAIKLLNRVTDKQIVIDMGSTKEELCELIALHPHRARFVATHPMWGTEYSGPGAARDDAFAGRTAVVLERERSAEEQDTHCAYVSHISHITSFALALTVLEKEREEEHIFDLAGGGFESTVRLAKSSARTWVPILMENKYNVLDVLREHIHQLQVLRKQIERDDFDALADSIAKANSIQRIIK